MNAQVRKLLDACPSYMVAEWSLPALINGDYTGIIPMDAPESCGEAAMVAQFDEDVVQGRSIIVDEEDGTINPVFCKDEITGTFTEFKKGGSMELIGNASMHGSVMNAILSMWNNYIKEIENA